MIETLFPREMSVDDTYDGIKKSKKKMSIHTLRIQKFFILRKIVLYDLTYHFKRFAWDVNGLMGTEKKAFMRDFLKNISCGNLIGIPLD